MKRYKSILESISPEDIQKANKTSRVWKETVVSKAVREFIDKEDFILDFGAGKMANQARILKDEGYNVVAYDFGLNAIDGLHDKNALRYKYDVVYASNVLNVQSSSEMMNTTLDQISKVLKPNGIFVANYTKTPRYMDMNANDLVNQYLSKYFSTVKKVGGGSSDPVWMMRK